MPKVNAFDKNARRYEEWRDEHPFAYLSELDALKELLPMHGSGIEIGIGSGKNALPLGIKQGIGPSRSMAEILVNVFYSDQDGQIIPDNRWAPPMTGKTIISLVKTSDREFVIPAIARERYRDVQ